MSGEFDAYLVKFGDVLANDGCRFLAWLLKLWTVREACLYPRYMGRCTP